MNLLFLFHFVFRQAAFGLVIGSPNLPVLDDGDVSGIVGKTYLRQVTLIFKLQPLEIFNTFQVWKAIIKFFHDNEHALMQTEHHKGEENREVGYGLWEFSVIFHGVLITQFRNQSIAIDASLLDIQRKLNNLDLLITLVSGK